MSGDGVLFFQGSSNHSDGHKGNLGSQTRKCDARGSPTQGQAMKRHHHLREGPLRVTVQGRWPQGCRVIWKSSWDVSIAATQYGWIPKMQVFSHLPLLSAWKHTLPQGLQVNPIPKHQDTHFPEPLPQGVVSNPGVPSEHISLSYRSTFPSNETHQPLPQTPTPTSA